MCSELLSSECNSKLNLSKKFSKTPNFKFYDNLLNSSQIVKCCQTDMVKICTSRKSFCKRAKIKSCLSKRE
jgi:hypothetical protein